MITTDERCRRGKRLILWYEIIAVASVLAAVGVLALSIRLPQIPDYLETIHYRNELLFPVNQINSKQVIVRALDLQSGRVRDTAMTPPGQGWITDGQRLWSYSAVEVVAYDGENARSFRPNRSLSKPFPPFLWDGKPAVVDSATSLLGVVSYHLLVWDQDNWQERGRIALPGTNRVWTDGGDGNEPRLLPATIEGRSAWYGERLTVIWHGGEFHLFHRDRRRGGNLSYHKGFDFAQPDDATSAMAPENASAQCSEWKRISDVPYKITQFGLSGDQFFVTGYVQESESNPNFLCVADAVIPSGQPPRFELRQQFGPEGDSNLVASAPGDETRYLITDRGAMGTSGHVQQIRDGRLTALPLATESMLDPILRQLRGFSLVIVMLFALAAVVFPRRATRIREESAETVVSRGHATVRLATLNSRYLARSIDLLLIGTPLFVPLLTELNRMDGDALLLFIANTADQSFLKSLAPPMALVGCLLASISLWLVLILVQGRWGLTPGKWLCGIRVVTSDLRPCGFRRSLFRELMLVVDLAEPGMISLLLTETQQRVGDRYADTVVVDDASWRERMVVRPENQSAETTPAGAH